MNVDHLWNKSRYVTPSNYIIGKNIKEVDVSKTNINILRASKVLDDETYDYLSNSDRMTRMVYIGKLQLKNSKVSEILKNRLREIRKMIFEIFCINPLTVLSIRNDAIIFVDNGYRNIPPNVSILTNMHSKEIQPGEERYWVSDFENFRVKNVYTSFYKIFDIEYLYYNNPMLKIEKLDIAGIDNDTLVFHENYFMDMLKTIFQSAEESNIRDTISLINVIYKNYISKSLDLGFYRNFNAQSMFAISTDISPNYNYYILHLSEDFDKNNLDISHNEGILKELIKIYSSIYFKQVKLF